MKEFRQAKNRPAAFSESEIAEFLRKYYFFTKKTIKLFTYLFFNSGLAVKNEKSTILYILNFKITDFGYEFFNLVNALSDLKREGFSVSSKSAEMLLNPVYLKIFEQFNEFFEHFLVRSASFGLPGKSDEKKPLWECENIRNDSKPPESGAVSQIFDFDEEYIERSMGLPAWKTRFIEGFVPLYRDFKRFCPQDNASRSFALLNLFDRMIRILKKRLKSGGKAVLLPSEVIEEAKKCGFIENSAICHEIIGFSVEFYNNNEHAKHLKAEYFGVLDEFYEKFSHDVKTVENPPISALKTAPKALFGLKKQYYEEIIKFLKKNKSVKILRIFGSRTDGSCGEFSDIDLIFEGNYTERGFERIKKGFQRLNIPYFADIYDVRYRLKPFIYRNTLRSRIFYRRSDFFEDDFVSFLEIN